MGCGLCRCCRKRSKYRRLSAEDDLELGSFKARVAHALGKPVSEHSDVEGHSADPPVRVSLPCYEARKATPARPHAVLSADEIITQGALLHGLHFPEWSTQDEEALTGLEVSPSGDVEVVLSDHESLLELSNAQQKKLDLWRRFPELLQQLQPEEGSQPLAVFGGTPRASNIQQGLVSDCSLISSLSVLAEYEHRFQKPVLSGIIYPQGRLSSGQQGPICNRNGQYACCLFFNGVCRRVVVDDRIPVGSKGELLCAHSQCKCELWVTLLEKAIVKIMGGSYALQGSNPGTDLFHLTGWIPESIAFKLQEAKGNNNVDWDETFNSFHEGFHSGKCVVCVGTSELADAVKHREAQRLGRVEGVSTSTGLVAGHAYPVLDCQCVQGVRLLFLKNPWGRVRWRGAFSPGSSTWLENPSLADALNYNPVAATEDDGCFWIEWKNVLRYFSHLYICWAPDALSLNEIVVHDRWDSWPHFLDSSLPDDTNLIAFNPQLLLKLDEQSAADVSVWVVLSRHVRSCTDGPRQFIAPMIFRGDERICCPDELVKQGNFSNGECALVKLKCMDAADARSFIVIVSQHACKADFSFTIQVYTVVPGALTPAPPLVPNTYESGAVCGRWTKQTAGGCSNDSWSYLRNPQWRLEVPEPGLEHVVFFVECPAGHTVNVRAFSGVTARHDTLGDAKSSGPYRCACCALVLAHLDPGSYVLVVSTFRAGLCAEYRLVWHAPQALDLHMQPHPFVAQLPKPLLSVARPVSLGRPVWLRLRMTGPKPQQTLVSLRLWTDSKLGAVPSLVLCRWHCTMRPVQCELQQELDAENYFASTGAVVILLASLVPTETYIVKILVPSNGRGYRARLHVNSDNPLALEETDLAASAKL